jgi:feruloyl esterase
VFDALSIVDAWASTGEAPERVVVSRPPGAPAMTRPLCPYPQVAKYTGTGSADDAANFVCKVAK